MFAESYKPWVPRKFDLIHQPWATGPVIFLLCSIVKQKHYKPFLKIRNIVKSILTCKKCVIQNNVTRPTWKHNVESWFVTTLAWSPCGMPCLFDFLTFHLPDSNSEKGAHWEDIWRINLERKSCVWKPQKHDRKLKRDHIGSKIVKYVTTLYFVCDRVKFTSLLKLKTKATRGSWRFPTPPWHKVLPTSDPKHSSYNEVQV